MIKTKFTWERSIIGCLLSFFIASIIFTGCGKDYDYDIESLTRRTNTQDSLLNDLKSQIAAVQTQVATIQSNIANARWITNVEATAEGYVFHFNTGTPNPITIHHGKSWQIGSGATTGTHTDSVWYYKDLVTGQFVKTDNPELIALPSGGRDGVDGAPGIPGRAPEIVDGYWVTYEWNASRNDFDEIPTGYQANGLIAYVTDNPENPNQWLLRVKKDAEGTGYETIALPKNAAGFPDGGTGNITLLGHISSPNALTLSLGAIDTSTLVVKYWYLDSIYVDQGVKLETWQGQKNVLPKQLLSTLPRELSLVLTSDLILSNACKLKNSKGEALPLVINAPVRYTGLLTKAENISGGPVYLASLSIVDSTYEKANVENNFANKFISNAIYYLENENGIKSNYSPFSIRAENHSTDVITTRANVTHLVDPYGGVIPINAGEVTVVINAGYTVGFDNAFYLHDYNIADSGNTGDIDVYPSLGSFMAMQPRTYSLKIRKLHVDGKIYEETISVVATE
jgi:hypothetical protein